MNWIINTIAGKLTEIKTGYAPGSTFTGMSDLLYYTRTYIEAQQLAMDLIVASLIAIVAAIIFCVCMIKLDKDC